MKLTLGFSPCPNDTFLFDALVHGRIDTDGLEFDVILDDVETLNQKAVEGVLDISKLSYHAYGVVRDQYILLNAGSALGNECGPLLIAKHPMTPPEIEAGKIALPGALTTAHFLFSLEYPSARNKVFTSFDQIEDGVLDGRFDAGVIIHENRFTYASKGLVRISDLGERWEAHTGYPIPLGGIAIRRSLPEKVQHKVDDLIRKSVEYAFRHPSASEEYVRAHAQEMDPGVVKQHIELYVNQYSVQLGVEGRKAVQVMLDRAAAIGLVPKVGLPAILDVKTG